LLKIAEAVSITTPTSTHFDVGMAALDAGCNILVEKPISVTIEQGKKLIEKARSKKLVLAVGHIERFSPAYMALAEQLGKDTPELIDIRRLSPFPARIFDVSVVMDVMIHDIDLARFLAKSEIKDVKAAGKKVKTERLDQANAVLIFKNGVVANIEADRTHTEKIRKLIASNMKASYDADLLSKTLKRSKNGKSTDIAIKSFDQLQYELKDFINSIIKKQKPSVTGEDGLAALEIALKIEEEARLSGEASPKS
jgi:predicted dehydrogenase